MIIYIDYFGAVEYYKHVLSMVEYSKPVLNSVNHSKHAQKKKLTKFAGKIEIDLTLIFCTIDFFCVILSS